MGIILGLIGFLLLGWQVLTFLSFKGSLLERFGLSFIVGSGLQSLFVFALLGVGQTLASSHNYWIFIGGLLMIFFFLNWFFGKKTFSVLPKTDISKKVILVWVGILFLFFITLLYATYEPVYMTDAISLYDFRAKVIFDTQSLKKVVAVENWAAYPMFTSMIHLIVRFWGSENANFYMPLMYLSFALVFYSNLKYKTNDFLAATATFLMYSTPLLLWQSKVLLNNLPYTIFLSSSIFYAVNIKDKSNGSNLLLSAILIGLSSWVRMVEPFWMLPVILILFQSFRIKKLWLGFSSLMVFQSIRGIWPVFAQDASLNSAVIRQTQSVIAHVAENINSSLVGAESTSYPLAGFVSALMDSATFLIGPISSAMGISIYALFLVLLCELFFRELSLKRLSFWILIGMLLFTWFGTLYGRLYLDYWKTLDNALNRMSGIFVPIAWMYVFESNIIKRLKAFS